MIELLVLAFVGMVLFTIAAVGLLIAKVLFLVVFWPLKLLFKVLFGLLILPIVAIVTLVALVVAGVALVIPLLPLFVVGLLIWLAVRNTRPAVQGGQI